MVSIGRAISLIAVVWDLIHRRLRLRPPILCDEQKLLLLKRTIWETKRYLRPQLQLWQNLHRVLMLDFDSFIAALFIENHLVLIYVNLLFVSFNILYIDFIFDYFRIFLHAFTTIINLLLERHCTSMVLILDLRGASK